MLITPRRLNASRCIDCCHWSSYMHTKTPNSAEALPKHVGIIPDGNRRWARQNGLELEEAYWYAMQRLACCLETLYSLGVSSVCVYLLSKDNILRARDDLEAVIKAEIRLLKELMPALTAAFSLRLYHAGNPGLLRAEYASLLGELCEPGNGVHDPFPRLYLCVGYDSYEEVIKCCDAPHANTKTLIDSLDVPLELDMVIRTGGDFRISGFLPLQSKYAEFFFEPYYFPEISEERVITITQQFQSRNRRFGK